MIKKDAFWRTLFNYVLIPVFLFVVVFFFYKKVYSRIVFLERDVKQLDFSDKYKTLEMKLETNNVYIDNIILQFDKRISKINKDVTSLSDDVTSLKSSIVAEDKFNELRSSVVTLDCLEDKLNDVRAFINKSLEEQSKLYSNLVEVKKEEAERLKKEEEEKLQKDNDEEEDDVEDEFEDNEDDVEDGEDDIEDDEDEEDDVEDEEDDEDDVEDDEDDYEDEEDDDEENEDDVEENEDVSFAPNTASDDTGENRGSENQECTDNKEDDKKKANVVADGKSKTESDDENDSDVENNQYKDLDEVLEDYDDYNEDIFFNDTDNKKKDVITQPNEQIDNKSAIGDYNRDKEVENLIQSLEQAKRRVDDLEGIVSNYEKGYSLFKLQACLGPSITWLMELIDKEKNDRKKIPCSFFLNLPFSRILPMISYHCLFYTNRGNEEGKENILNEEEIDKKEENNNIENEINEENFKDGNNINNENNKVGGKNISNKEIINEKNAVKNINGGKKINDIIKDKNGRNIGDVLETSPTMFCVSLLRIIKTSLFFLDFGFKIYYPEKPDESALTIVKNFWGEFKGKIFTRDPWCLFLGFNLGPQLLCFFSFSCSDWSSFRDDWDAQRARMDEGELECGILFKKILDNFTIEIRFFEVSI